MGTWFLSIRLVTWLALLTWDCLANSDMLFFRLSSKLGKAGSSAKQVLMQELRLKRNVCVTKPPIEESSNQCYVETVAFELKVGRGHEGLTGKPCRLAVQVCAK